MGSYTRVHPVEIHVIGRIWQPGIGLYSMSYSTSCEQWQAPGFTHDNVQAWLDCYAGDFQEIVDFQAYHGDEEIPWANDDSEVIYNDCTFGD